MDSGMIFMMDVPGFSQAQCPRVDHETRYVLLTECSKHEDKRGMMRHDGAERNMYDHHEGDEVDEVWIP